MSTPFKTLEKEALGVIAEFATAGTKKAAPVAAPKLALEPIELPAGHRWFSDVFGWQPATLPRDIPVATFAPTDWPTEIRSYIPKRLPNGGLWTWPRKATEQLALALYAGDRTLIHGPTGSGKSALWQAFAHTTNIPLIRVNCHGEQQSTDFLGKDIIAVDPASNSSVLRYEHSMVTIAARHGGILLLDEAFRSPVLMCIQSLLERDGDLTLPDAASLTADERHIVPPAGRFWLGLTDNTNGTGDESGAYNAEVQDLSTLGRITAIIECGYMEVGEQSALLATAHPKIPSRTLNELSQWANVMRQAFTAKTVMQPICMRVLLSICRKYEITGSLELAIDIAYLAKLGPADKTVAAEAYHQVTARPLVVHS